MGNAEKPIDIWAFIEDINFKKRGDLLNEETNKVYNQFMINKALSNTIDTLFYASELNLMGKMTNAEHYKYLIHSIPKKNRWAKWVKEEKDPNIDLIIECYKCSRIKAKEILKMLKPEHLEKIRLHLDKGGAEKAVRIPKKDQKERVQKSL